MNDSNERTELMSDNKVQIEKLVEQIESLPTLPVISQRIIEIAGKEDSTIQDMAFIIEKDQALATKVLKIANSTFYSNCVIRLSLRPAWKQS